jgi:multidrug resistance protein, MATE family
MGTEPPVLDHTSSSRKNGLEPETGPVSYLLKTHEGKALLWQEFKRWSHQALPVGVSILARNLQVVTDLSFLGRLSDKDPTAPSYLSAASLAFLWLTVSSGWLWKSFGSSLNTLCAQSIGAGNHSLQHVWLHISILLLLLLCGPIYLGWAFTEQLLLLGNFDPALCALAGKFARYLMLWLLPSDLFVLYSNYLQTQGSVYPIMIVNLIMLGVNALLNWLLIFGPNGNDGLGFIGSPIATSLTSWLSFLLVAGYCHWPSNKVHEMDWRTYKKEVLSWQRMKTFLAQAVPTSAGNLIEDLQFTVMSFLAAGLGATAIAVHNSTLNLFLAATCLLYGAVKATTVRVGHYIGAGDIRMAKAVGYMNLAVMSVIALVIGILFCTLREDLGAIFSSEDDFKQLMGKISVPLGIGYCALSLFFSAVGVLQGQARVTVVAVAFLIGAWGVTVPLAFVFVKKLNMGLLGVWLALVVGYSVITALCGIAVFRSDWPDAVRQAQERTAKRKAQAQAEEDATAKHDDGGREPLLEKGSSSVNASSVQPVEGGGTTSILPSMLEDVAEGELEGVTSQL